MGEKILEDEGVLGDVNSVEWPLYFHSLDKDVLSMELNESFGELYLVGDPSEWRVEANARSAPRSHEHLHGRKGTNKP